MVAAILSPRIVVSRKVSNHSLMGNGDSTTVCQCVSMQVCQYVSIIITLIYLIYFEM